MVDDTSGSIDTILKAIRCIFANGYSESDGRNPALLCVSCYLARYFAMTAVSIEAPFCRNDEVGSSQQRLEFEILHDNVVARMKSCAEKCHHSRAQAAGSAAARLMTDATTRPCHAQEGRSVCPEPPHTRDARLPRQ